MEIMSYQDWMSATSRSFKPRSRKLKAIDAALRDYHSKGKSRPLLDALKKALNEWIAAKGPNWQASIRNQPLPTVATLKTQIENNLGPSLGMGEILQRRAQLRPPPIPGPQPPGRSLRAPAIARQYARAIMDNVHTPWATLTPNQRISAMHGALADLFASMNITRPALRIVSNLGNDVGRFNFPTWQMQINSKPFQAGQPTHDEFLEMAKTIYHEGRHCEQWFLMARYAAGDGPSTAAEIAANMGIPDIIARHAQHRPMNTHDPMFRQTRTWFESVYGISNREITLQAARLRRVTNAQIVADMRNANHQRYATNLPEEADAWGSEALIDEALSLWLSSVG